jgi:sugar phosphate isomerase/epimerase
MSGRRNFLKKSLAGVALLSASSLAAEQLVAGTPGVSEAHDTIKPKTPKATNPFQIGMAGFTFVNFDLETTLKTMKSLDLHYLCIKDFHLPLDADADKIKEFHDKCASYGVTGYAVGPIYMRSEAEIDRGFEYCKRVGTKLIVGVPNYELLPYVDKKVKEYGYNYAIHLHGPDIKTYPDATDVWVHTKDLDPRIGMCLDIGHDLRNGCDPVADLQKYHTRVFDIHLKDVTDSTKEGHGIEIGRGKIDFPRFVKMLRKVNYTGKVSLEYEKDMKDPFLGIAESIGYFKAICDYTK